MKINIMIKQVTVILLAVLISTGAVFFTSFYFTKVGFDLQTKNNIVGLQNIIDTFLKERRDKNYDVAILIAENPKLIAAIKDNDKAKVDKISKTLMQSLELDLFVVYGIDSNIVSGEYSSQHGDSANHKDLARKSLQGNTIINYTNCRHSPLSTDISSPIKYNGKIIATLIIGKSIVSSEVVTELKNTFGVEATVFHGDTRAITTLVKPDGTLAIGTKIQNTEVIETVLENGGIFLQKNTLFGKIYETAYWPISKEDSSLGMWFIGMPISITENALAKIQKSVILVAGSILAVMLLISILYARSFVLPILKITAFSVDVSNGKLDAELNVKTNDELGTLANGLRKMLLMLKAKIQEAEAQSILATKETQKAKAATLEAAEAHLDAAKAQREGSIQAANSLSAIVNTVSSSSYQLSSQIEQATKGADLQKAQTLDITSAMSEMTSTIIAVAQNATEASSTATVAKEQAEAGALVVKSVVDDIKAVQILSETLEQSMGKLNTKTNDIGRIMSIISDIADQTNLLALNAAIEAARAGDAGRGFAVVADEVRKLAEKTMLATKDVNEAIIGIQKGTQENVAQVAETVKKVLIATDKTSNAGNTLKEIVDLSETTSIQVQSIATASMEQSSTSEDINRSITEISSIAIDTSDAMMASSQVLKNLIEQTVELQKVIEHLQNS